MTGGGHRVSWRLAHAAPAVLTVVAVVVLAVAVLSAVELLPVEWSRWFSLPPLLVAVVFCVVSRRHETTLCGLCAELTPLDGTAAAHRYRFQLRLYHARWLLLLLLYLPGSLGAVAVSWLDLPDPLQRLSLVSYLVTTAVQAAAWTRHSLLEPWCPQCRDDGPWHPEPLPLPEPTESGRT